MSADRDLCSSALRRGQAQVDTFCDAMLVELNANAWKGDDWLQAGPVAMMLDAIYHAVKFLLALNDEDMDGVGEFAADVGNCAWMAADAAGALAIRDTDVDECVAVPWRNQAIKTKRALGLAGQPPPHAIEAWLARLVFEAPYGGPRKLDGEDY